mmetsp:Transcript_116322/g.183016  ORF Transcript_116322/g.183016 Transcript_116322/m.183016 type:complete len:222 (-) Transcript_116322:284-949(-)
MEARRKKTSIDQPKGLGSDFDSKLPKVPAAERATQPLDELPPLSGGFCRALMSQQKRTKEWDLDGRARWKVADSEVAIERLLVDAKVPIERFSRNQRLPARVLLVPMRERASCRDEVPRCGFHRYVYQKARYLRKEHGGAHASFQQVGRDVMHSVGVCMQVTDVGRDLKKLVSEPMQDECESDAAILLDLGSEAKMFPKRDRWKNLLADTEMQRRILSFLD